MTTKAAPAPKLPEWVIRALAKRLPAKDLSTLTLRGSLSVR